MRKETRYYVGGWTDRKPTPGSPGTADWFVCNMQFMRRSDAVAYMKERREAFAEHGREAHFTFREETVKVFY